MRSFSILVAVMLSATLAGQAFGQGHGCGCMRGSGALSNSGALSATGGATVFTSPGSYLYQAAMRQRMQQMCMRQQYVMAAQYAQKHQARKSARMATARDRRAKELERRAQRRTAPSYAPATAPSYAPVASMANR